MRTDDRVKNSCRHGMIKGAWSWAVRLIMIVIFNEGLKMFIVVNLAAKLFGEPAVLADLSGSGHLMLTAKILPVDRITGMIESWFSVARVGS